MSDLFRWILLALRLSARKSDIKKNSDFHWNIWTNTKKLYARNNIFKKRLPNTRFWIIYVLVQISLFWGLFLGISASVFFLIFCRWSTMVADIFTQLRPHTAPTIKELHRAHHKLFLLWQHHQNGCQPRLKRKQKTERPCHANACHYISYQHSFVRRYLGGVFLSVI